MTTIDSPSHPLYGIDDLDWSQWYTAYGDATDTQWNLKRLVNSRSRKTKENALWNLRVSVYHQGGNYSAIPIALDYLIRILKAGCLANKLELDLLCLISNLGRLDLFHGRWVATGIPTKDDLTQFLSGYESPDEVTIFYQAYAKMEDLRDYCLEKFKSHKDFAFRCQCIHLLMYLQKDQQSIIEALQHQYPIEKNRNVRLSIIWAISFIAMHLPPEKQQQIHQWILLHRPRIYRGVTAHMFTLAELYLGEITLTIEKEFMQMIKDNIKYPILLDQDRFQDSLDRIALLLINKKYSSSAKHYQFYKEILEILFDLPATERSKQYCDPRIEAIIEILITLLFPEPVGIHQYWSDHSLQEQKELLLKLNSQQLDLLTFLCLHPVWKNHVTEDFLKKCRLPESYEEIALFLGWLPEFDYWQYKDQHLNKPQIDQFPELKPIIEYCGLIPFIEKFFPLSNIHLQQGKSIFNWQNLSTNSAIKFTAELIHQHQDLWYWGILSNNPAVNWDTDLLSRFTDKVYWTAISELKDLDWTPSFIKQFIDYWDWEDLSLNESLTWSIELIVEFKQHWDWRDLSSNPALPWSVELIDRFAGYWDWEELSENESLPWSEEFFNQYAKRWWHYKDALARNSKIPWTEARLKKFDGFYWEHYLSQNNGLPWSEEFIDAHKNKIDWYNFSKVTAFTWTEAFIEQYKENLGFARLAENTSLPWSADLIMRYKDKWNWYVLSKNPALPWSFDLLKEFESYWDWGTLPHNPHIQWTKDMLSLLAKRTQGISRITSTDFPWTLELVNNPAFAYIFDKDDKSLYTKIISPLLNEEKVSQLLLNHQLHINVRKQQRLDYFLEHGPDIELDHPLRKILGLDHPI